MAGVKALIDSGIRLLPDAYASPQQDHRPCNLVKKIPVIDISNLEEPERKDCVLEDLRIASEEWGFFQLVGHGFPTELMQAMPQLVDEFFQLPAEERSIFYSDAFSKRFKLGTSFNPSAEKRLLWQDYLFQMCYPSPPRDDELPSRPSSYRKTSRAYAKRMNALAKHVLALFSESLGLDSGALEQAMQGERHTMRMNYYPPCPNPELAIGLESHSDPNTFTILQQDVSVEGLQIMHEGKWISVKPLPNAFVINVGDQLQILSNGRYKSVEHRAVVNSTQTRISIGSFYGPGEEARIAPVRELVSEGGLYKESTYGEYLRGFYSKGLNGKSALDVLKV